jgi:hypothetical protein
MRFLNRSPFRIHMLYLWPGEWIGLLEALIGILTFGYVSFGLAFHWCCWWNIREGRLRSRNVAEVSAPNPSHET